MPRLEDLKPGAQVEGLVRHEATTVVDAKWHGSDCVELTYKRLGGPVENRLLYRSDEANLTIVQPGCGWEFTGDGAR
ncbi:hypothetical protein, partial [Ferrimicrobium sp.]|uniref:hypothetical protein n=1 Tax=Ferrimicrobium sp. TaxID=2926050 RepID=UPI00262F63B1